MKSKPPRSQHNASYPSRKLRTPKSASNSVLSHLDGQYLWLTGILIGAFGFFWLLRPVFALLAASAGIAYILDPIVDSFERKGFSRDQGIAWIVVIGGGLLLFVFLLLIPPIVLQIEQLGQNMEAVLGKLEVTLQTWTRWLETQTNTTIDINLDHIKETLPHWIEQLSMDWQTKALDILKGLLLTGMGFVNGLLNLLLLPVFTYYLLRDWDRLLERTFHLFPLSTRPVVQKTMSEVNERLNAFVIGQIKVCLSLSLLYSIGLWIIGIDLAWPIGILSGILFVIPYFGTIFGIVASTFLTLLKFGVDWHLIGIVAVFGISQMIEGYLLTPKIIGDSVGLSPLVVMIALIVGASFMGLWGMMLAIPITAVLSVFSNEWLEQYKQSRFFNTEPKANDSL